MGTKLNDADPIPKELWQLYKKDLEQHPGEFLYNLLGSTASTIDDWQFIKAGLTFLLDSKLGSEILCSPDFVIPALKDILDRRDEQLFVFACSYILLLRRHLISICDNLAPDQNTILNLLENFDAIPQ